MLILVNTTDKIQLVTQVASAIAVHASVADHTLSTDNYEAAVQNTSISTATTTDIVSAPSSGNTRNVISLFVRNGGTEANVVTVRYNANGTTYDLFKTQIPPNRVLIYTPDKGFCLLKSDKINRLLVAQNDYTSAATTICAIPEFNFQGKAGRTYFLRAELLSSGASSGVQISVFGPGSPTYLRIAGRRTHSTSAIAAGTGTQTASATAYDSSATGAPSAGPSAQSLIVACGVVVPPSNGNISLRYRSGGSSFAANIHAGSSLLVREPDNV